MTEFSERLKERAAARNAAGPSGQTDIQSLDIQTTEDRAESFSDRLAARQRLRESGINTPGPLQVDRARRNEFLAAQTGGDFLGTPGFEGAARFDIGLSDTFEEKKAKFLDKFPDGNFVEVLEPPKGGQIVEPGRGGTTILFRKNQNEPFAEFDADLLDKSEILMDLADFSGEIPSAAIEIAVVRGGGLVKQLLKVAGSSVAGDTLKESVEAARGFQRETLSEFGQRAIERAGIATLGAGATVFVSGPINAVRGAPSIAVAKSAPAAQRAAKKLGVPGLLPSQIGRSPLIRKLGGQAGATLKTVGDYVSRQQESLVRGLTKLREPDLALVLRGEVEALHESARKQILQAAKLNPRSLSESGSAIQSGIAEYDELATALVNRKYSAARGVETPEFDLKSLRAVAENLKAGTRGVSKGGGEVVLSGPQKELDDLLNKVLALDPSLPPTARPDGTIVDATDQLRALRSQLWDLKTPGKGEIARQPEKQAGELFAAITNTLQKPKNASPEFIEAWAKANGLAASRFDVMEKLMVVQASRTETPAILASRLAQPNQVDSLRILQEVMPPSRYREFQEGIASDLISPGKVDALTKRLDSFDQPTLDLMLTRADQVNLRRIGSEIDNLNKANIQGALQDQAKTSGLLDQLIDSGDATRIKRIAKASLVTPDSPLRKSARAGIMERVWDKSVKNIEGVQTLDRNTLQSEIKRLRETGAISLLDANDIRTLSQIDTILEFVPTTLDTGTSIQAASAAAGVRGLSVNAFMTVLEHIGTGRLLTSPVFQRAVLGSGKKPLNFASLRVTGAILAQVAKDLEDG